MSAIIAKERKRQEEGLEMIPSESYASKAVMQAVGSLLNNKYAEGYPGKRYYGGTVFVDEAEQLAIDRAKQVFGAAHVNVQPYSGSPANIAVLFALLNFGDPVLGMSLAEGGHLTHGHKVNFSGKAYKFAQYGVDPKTHRIDMDAVRKLALEHKPKLIISGATAYPRHFDFKAFHEIAEKVGAYSMADISHIAGLIAGSVHPSPFPFTDIVTTTTHKTFCGPRGGIIMCKVEDRLHDLHHPTSKFTMAQLIDRAIFPGLQGGPHEHQIAAKAVALGEMLKPDFKLFAAQIVKNAKALADSLMAEGINLISGGTDNHLILADLRSVGVGGQAAETALDAAGITVNKNMIPGDPRPPMDPSGIRMGTPALTQRGMKEGEMQHIGKLMAKAIRNHQDAAVLARVRGEVLELTREFPLYLF